MHAQSDVQDSTRNEGIYEFSRSSGDRMPPEKYRRTRLEPGALTADVPGKTDLESEKPSNVCFRPSRSTKSAYIPVISRSNASP